MAALLNHFVAIVGGVLLLLNVFGVLVAGVWLSILEEWGTFGVGLAAGVAAVFVLRAALLPKAGLASTALSLRKKQLRVAAVLCEALSEIYTILVMSTWCMGTFLLLSNGKAPYLTVPLFLLAYSVATIPINYLAYLDEGGGGGANLIALSFFIQISCVAGALAIILFRGSIIGLAVTFYIPMALYLLCFVLSIMTETDLKKTEGDKVSL